jgi:hypothetical protein
MKSKNRHTTRRKLLTSGRAWLPLNGSTWQEEGTLLFLLKEVKWWTSFSKSFKGRSSESMSESSAPEYHQRGFLRVVGDNSLLIHLSTFRKGGREDRTWWCCKMQQQN